MVSSAFAMMCRRLAKPRQSISRQLGKTSAKHLEATGATAVLFFYICLQAAGFAAGALMNTSFNATNAEAICAAGGIAPLVELLEAGADSVAATYAAGALMNQAFYATSAEAIRAAGGIAHVCVKLISTSPMRS